MGEVIQLQGDQRKDVQEFLVDKKEGLALDAKTIKVMQNTPAPIPTMFMLTCSGRSTASSPAVHRPRRTVAWTNMRSPRQFDALAPCSLYDRCRAFHGSSTALADTPGIMAYYDLG